MIIKSFISAVKIATENYWMCRILCENVFNEFSVRGVEAARTDVKVGENN